MVYIRRGKRAYKKKVVKKGKRWYVNASANLPFVGKTTFAAGSGLQKRNFQEAVKQVIRKEELPNHYSRVVTLDDAISNSQYPNILPIPSFIPLEDNADRDFRTSDLVHLETLKLKGFFSVPTSESTYIPSQRIMLIRTPDYLSPTSLSFITTSSLKVSDMSLHTQTGTSGSSIAIGFIPDRRKVNIIYDNVFNYPASPVGTCRTHSWEVDVKLDQKFRWETGSYAGDSQNIYLLSLTYAPYMASNATFGNFMLESDLIFKNVN